MSTITEALAEIKTIDKRLDSKRMFVNNFVYHVDSLKDPHEKDGGSAKLIEQELQAIDDLEARIVAIRRGIQSANENNKITVEGVEKSIADWLIWRREVAPSQERFMKQLKLKLNSARDILRKNSGPYQYGSNPTPVQVQNIVVNIDENKLNKENEKLEKILGDLDGQLSLKNATIMI